MLTVLHTGDIHLGATLQKLGDRKDDQRVQIQKTFESIVDFAIGKKVDIFLIAGDLFDSLHPEKSLIDFVLSNLARLNDRHIYTCIALGTHDFIQEKGSFYGVDLSSLSHIKVFSNPDELSFAIPELSCIIFSKTAVSNKSGESPLQGIIRNDEYDFNIAIAHGSFQIPGKSSLNDSPITQEEINASNMDYVALGHWHNQQEVGRGKVKAWYCGAPEMIDLDQDGSGNILLVYLEKAQAPVIESVHIGRRVFSQKNIVLDGITNMEDLISKIRENPNPDEVRVVVLDGMIQSGLGSINEAEIRRRLDTEFFYLIIKNNGQVNMNIGDIAEGDIVKMKFIENIKRLNKDERVMNDALQLGMMLLDGTAKVY